MDIQLMVAFDTEELERLKSSNLLRDFVSKQDGNWNHSQWEGFLSSVRELGYALPSHVIGAELEVEKEFYWKVRRGEISVPELPEIVKDAAIESALVCQDADRMLGIAPALGEEPKGPQMPRKDLFDPVMELESSVIHETSLKPEEAPKAKAEDDEHPWDNVDFDTLSKEERAEYLKSQLRKKMGEG